MGEWLEQQRGLGPNKADPYDNGGTGDRGACCAELDLLEANKGPYSVNVGSRSYLVEDDEEYKFSACARRMRRTSASAPTSWRATRSTSFPHAREDSVLEKDWQGTYGIKQNGDNVELIRMLEKENSFDFELLRMLEKEKSFDVDMNNPTSRIGTIKDLPKCYQSDVMDF